MLAIGLCKTYLSPKALYVAMYRHGFVEKEITPDGVFEEVKNFLEQDGFKLTYEESKDNLYELHAKKSSRERIAIGKVRDVDIVISGQQGKFEVQVHAGIWGRDLAVPVLEGALTLGIATAAEIHGGHEYELNLWKRIVKLIDPSLKVCDVDGLLFQNQADLDQHMKTLQQQSTASPYMGMGMMGMGMLGMGMMGGFWI